VTLEPSRAPRIPEAEMCPIPRQGLQHRAQSAATPRQSLFSCEVQEKSPPGEVDSSLVGQTVQHSPQPTLLDDMRRTIIYASLIGNQLTCEGET